MALDVVRREPDIDVTALLVTLNAAADRVAMHGVRRSLVEAQADRLGLPLKVVEIPALCSNDVYEARMSAALEEAIDEGVEHIVFGDLFLEDVRAYRESRLAGTGVSPRFPLWGRPTDVLAQDILSCGSPRGAHVCRSR